jgi:hypothetical protein
LQHLAVPIRSASEIVKNQLALAGGHIWEADETSMRKVVEVNQLTKISIDRNENSCFFGCKKGGNYSGLMSCFSDPRNTVKRFAIPGRDLTRPKRDSRYSQLVVEIPNNSLAAER